MNTIDNAIVFMEGIARDDSHGYSQRIRWPWEGSDFDCSSLVIYSWMQAGVPLTCTYTGNMLPDMLAKGFSDVTSSVNIKTGAGLKRGDVLWRDGHTAMYCGNGLEVEAAASETGGIYGQPGDQTGYEILIQPYVPNWSVVLRYTAEEPTEKWLYITYEVRQIQNGDSGEDVKTLQKILRGMSYRDNNNQLLKRDGIFGQKTEEALIKAQEKLGLVPDGICGPASWSKLTGLFVQSIEIR